MQLTNSYNITLVIIGILFCNMYIIVGIARPAVVSLEIHVFSDIRFHTFVPFARLSKGDALKPFDGGSKRGRCPPRFSVSIIHLYIIHYN